jgi:hypothetical protein
MERIEKASLDKSDSQPSLLSRQKKFVTLGGSLPLCRCLIDGLVLTVGKYLQYLSAIQFHPAGRFSMNSFIESFGGKRSVKGNMEDRSWHAFHR